MLEDPTTLGDVAASEQNLWFIDDNQYFAWMEIYLARFDAPRLERVVFRMLPEPEARILALEAGEVDMVLAGLAGLLAWILRQRSSLLCPSPVAVTITSSSSRASSNGASTRSSTGSPSRSCPP